MIAIDTNIFVYLYDLNEPEKQAKAQAFFARLADSSEPYVVLWQVAVELLSVFRKWVDKGEYTASDIKRLYSLFLKINDPLLPTRRVLDCSIELRDRYSLSHWDSLLVAACLEAGVTKLYSEDMTHEAHYETVQVLNPFLMPGFN